MDFHYFILGDVFIALGYMQASALYSITLLIIMSLKTEITLHITGYMSDFVVVVFVVVLLLIVHSNSVVHNVI